MNPNVESASRWLSLAFALACGLKASAQPALPPLTLGAMSAERCEIEGLLAGRQGLLVVPENRAARESRPISIHFFHFPAREASTLPPVFFLPGGPGAIVDENSIRRALKRPEPKQRKAFCEVCGCVCVCVCVCVHGCGRQRCCSLWQPLKAGR